MSDSVRPQRWQPTRLRCPWDSPGTLEWVAISFSSAWKWKVKVKLLSRVRLFVTPWTAAYQALPSVGFSRQECCSGLPLPSSIYMIYIYFKFEKLVLFILEFWIHTIPFQVNSEIEIKNNYDPTHKKVNHYVAPLKLIQCCTSTLLLFSH